MSSKTEASNGSASWSLTGKGFTGWHMLLIMCLFFGVIIVVNIIMATSAIRSWSGLVVPNSYVASQEFNDKSIIGRAHLDLGWQTGLTYENGIVEYHLNDREGQPVNITSAEITFKRPVNEAEDQTIILKPDADGIFRGMITLKDGNWIAEITTKAGLEEDYRYNGRFVIVKKGLDDTSLSGALK